MSQDIQEPLKRLNAVFCEVFDDDAIVITETSTAEDIEGWDSLGHISLILSVEKEFKIRFSTSEVAETKKPGQDVGAFLRMIIGKISK